MGFLFYYSNKRFSVDHYKGGMIHSATRSHVLSLFTLKYC